MTVTTTEWIALATGPVGLAVGKFLSDYLRRRQDAAIAAEAARTETERAKVAAGAAERTDVIALLRDQIAKGEERGEKSAARSDAMADALRAVAEQTRALSGAVDDLRGAVTEHAGREEDMIAGQSERIARLEAQLDALLRAPSTGEQPRASVVPDLPRPPAPPLRPATPALPPRGKP